MRFLPVVLLAVGIQVAPQNPSPMRDTTRPHPRIARYDVPGQRVPLSTGTLYLSPRFTVGERVRLLVHFHGAPWLIEHHVHTGLPSTALVAVQIGGGSRVYAEAFADPAKFSSLIAEASNRLAERAGRRVEWESITLTSFSAGYGAVRSILQDRASYDGVDGIILADSLHASYAAEVTASRAADLPVDEKTLDPFIRFAMDAAGGRKRMRVTHSEVFPGTYASTTETADVLLERVSIRRRRVLRDGPIGMQQLSEASKGNFHLSGFAGNSAADHMDHFYALGQWFK